MREVELNLTKEQVAGFIDWLANDEYWGHTISDYELSHGEEEVVFIINGHRLSNYSGQHHHVVIDNAYVSVHQNIGVIADGQEFKGVEYALYKLGF